MKWFLGTLLEGAFFLVVGTVCGVLSIFFMAAFVELVS